MADNYKILYIGDIVGRAGRFCAKKFLFEENNKKNYDFVAANIENASHGFGLTKKNHDELISWGIDIMSSGNHIWDKKDILTFINESSALVRPYNYGKHIEGTGYRIFDNKVVVINLLGKVFMPQSRCPFESLEELIKEKKEEFQDKIIIIDFHAEATAEKQCMSYFARDLGVSAVLGTHTHIQTADETILDNKLAYITDIGSCSSTQGVIGMDYQTSIKRLLSPIPERFEVEMKTPYKFNAVELEFLGTKPISIKRININYDKTEGGTL